MKHIKLPKEVYKKNKRWCKKCHSCGVEQSYLRRNYAYYSFVLKKECKQCSSNNINKNGVKIYKGIRVSWFNKFKTNAELRGLDWDITIDDLVNLYKKQKGKCALTGWYIYFPENGHPQKTNASIDRIDSSLGYTLENIQLVEKKVNMMKQQYSQEEFISVCVAVADKIKW